MWVATLAALTLAGTSMGMARPAGPEPTATRASGWLATVGDDTDVWAGDSRTAATSATVSRAIGADVQRSRIDANDVRFTGAGIGVALVDSGVVPVRGLDDPAAVINGPDLSFESQSEELRHLDSFGHGTHLAGIIAGRNAPLPRWAEGDRTRFTGIAPGAHIVNLKVAASDGATDVSQVIAAIDWVVAHHDDPGLDIRVLNLSYGTTSLQPYEIDPLAHAVESAWHAGIVVVVAAGNDGADGTTLTNPAIDPYVIAVGAADDRATSSTADDVVADFSSVGRDARRPDLVAPGRSVPGLRNPGSYIDERHPEARQGKFGAERLFRGSGTSQAAAVASGAIALLLDERPELTPDQVKHLLIANATPLADGSGLGQLQLRGIHTLDADAAPAQDFARSTGTGSLEAARGGSHVADPTTGEELVGEVDIFGRPWDAAAWAAASTGGWAWDGGTWNGTEWTGSDWDGSSWAGITWRSVTWTAPAWTGITWRTDLWSGITWRGAWSGITWRDAVWSGITWREATWSSHRPDSGASGVG